MLQKENRFRNQRMLKKLGSISAVLSILCAVHCVLFPIVLVSAPLIGLQFSQKHGLLEFLIFAIVVLAGGVSLFWGYFKMHQNSRPLVLMAFAIGLWLLVHIIEISYGETVLAATAGLLIAGSQIWNLKLSKRKRQAQA